MASGPGPVGNMARILCKSAVLALLVGAVGCSNSPVGDPCIPEAEQRSFLDDETYLETSSVQCATRVCIVRDLGGNPNNLENENPELNCPLGPETCVSQQEVEDAVYCTCRCSAPAGSSVPTCGCPNGFTCEEILETGGDGIRGGYCVRDIAPNN